MLMVYGPDVVGRWPQLTLARINLKIFGWINGGDTTVRPICSQSRYISFEGRSGPPSRLTPQADSAAYIDGSTSPPWLIRGRRGSSGLQGMRLTIFYKLCLKFNRVFLKRKGSLKIKNWD